MNIDYRTNHEKFLCLFYYFVVFPLIFIALIIFSFKGTSTTSLCKNAIVESLLFISLIGDVQLFTNGQASRCIVN
jgi:hypothetical protein